MAPNRIWTIADFGAEQEQATIGRGDSDFDTSTASADNNNNHARPAAVKAPAWPVSSAWRETKSDAARAQKNSNNIPPSNFSFECRHIPGLDNAPHAESLLRRVAAEFQPIIARRHYNVRSISEMCCCGDGLDAVLNGGSGGSKRRRKRRIMSKNVWGYNQTTFGWGGNGNGNSKSHTIHLRLRHPADHARLLSYEDVAGTLAHELAHCQHAAHNDKFYALMDEILDEHAVLMASGRGFGSGANTGYLSFGGAGRRLGGGGGGNNANGNNGANSAAAAAAAAARDRRGVALGGDATFAQWMTPLEAAVAAAEARRRQQQLRLRGDDCCRPCAIAIGDSDDDEVEVVENEGAAAATAAAESIPVVAAAIDRQKRYRADNTENEMPSTLSNKHSAENINLNTTPTGSSVGIVIDLTADDDHESKPSAIFDRARAAPDWACDRCTYRNQALALACDVCATERGVKNNAIE